MIAWILDNWELLSAIIVLAAKGLQLFKKSRKLGLSLESVVQGVMVSDSEEVELNIKAVSLMAGTEKTLKPIVEKVKKETTPEEIADKIAPIRDVRK